MVDKKTDNQLKKTAQEIGNNIKENFHKAARWGLPLMFGAVSHNINAQEVKNFSSDNDIRARTETHTDSITSADILNPVDHSSKTTAHWGDYEEDIVAPESVDEREPEDAVASPKEFYPNVKDKKLEASTLNSIKNNIARGFEGSIQISDLSAEHAVQIANSLTKEELEPKDPDPNDPNPHEPEPPEWEPDEVQALANVYINSYNSGENTDIDVLAQALNGQLGNLYMAESGGISLNIHDAQALLKNGKVNPNNFGMDEVSFLKRAVNDSYNTMGAECFEALTPEQSVRIANSLTPEELQQWAPEKQQALASVYIAAHNVSFNNGEKANLDFLAEVLNGPLGKLYMSENGGISLNIINAEDLLAQNKINLNNIGMDRNSFLVRALSDTYSKLPSQVSRMELGDKRQGVEGELLSKAYKYAQDPDIMSNMKNGASSIMGAYALQTVFKDKEGQIFSIEDQKVLDNVKNDIIANQDSKVAFGNYDRLCIELARRTPNYYKKYGEMRRSGDRRVLSEYEKTNEGLARAFLITQLQDIHGSLDTSKSLAQHKSVLNECSIRVCESEKCRAIFDFSIALSHIDESLVNKKFDKINREDVLASRQGPNIDKYCTQRQADFAMYMKYYEMKQCKKISAEDDKKLGELEAKYGKDFLKRAYDYVSAIHHGDKKQAIAAKQAIQDNDNITLPAQDAYKNITKVPYMRGRVIDMAEEYIGADNQWNNLVTKGQDRRYSFGISAGRVQSASQSVNSKKTSEGGEPTSAATINVQTNKTSMSPSMLNNFMNSKANQA